MSDENSITIEMVQWSCASCGCVQCMPKTFERQLRATHNTFWCLNGHSNIYNAKTDIEEIQGQLVNEYAKNAQLEARIKELEKSLINRLFKP